MWGCIRSWHLSIITVSIKNKRIFFADEYRLTEIFPERENLSLIVDECRTLLNNQIDLDQAIAAICEMDEDMKKIWIMAINIGFI